MKRLVMAFAFSISLGCVAHAQDPRVFEPVGLVPAEPVYFNWSGFYFGGQGGLTTGTLDPGSGTSSMIAYILRQTTIENEAHVSQWQQLRRVTTTGSTYGGFAGYNSQWDDVILGVELSYNFGRLSANSSDSIARTFVASDGYLYDISVASQVAVAVKDYGTLRMRAGWVMDRFLPYVTFGGTVARADVSKSVTVAATGTDVTHTPPYPNVSLGPTTMSESRKNAFIFGYNIGVGLDVAITQNLFLRGEYEYMQLFPADGVQVSTNTGRVGLAVKF
jgi:opacity protein-like surface antigen